MSVNPSRTPRPKLVEDDQVPGPDQCRRSTFLRALVSATQANAEVTDDCPLLGFWLGFYERQPAARIEQACRKFAPQISELEDPMDWIPVLRARLREGMLHGRTSVGRTTGRDETS